MRQAPDSPWYDTIVMPALLRHARSAYGDAMRRALADAGCEDLPANGMFVIGGLAMGAGDAPLGSLVRLLGVSKQGAGQLIDTLVLRGYLTRRPDADDRRKLSIVLTERGWHAAHAQRGARERIDAALLAAVGPDDAAVARRVLGALCEVGAKDREAATP